MRGSSRLESRSALSPRVGRGSSRLAELWPAGIRLIGPAIPVVSKSRPANSPEHATIMDRETSITPASAACEESGDFQQPGTLPAMKPRAGLSDAFAPDPGYIESGSRFIVTVQHWPSAGDLDPCHNRNDPGFPEAELFSGLAVGQRVPRHDQVVDRPPTNHRSGRKRS